MALLDVVAMTPEQRAERRERDEAFFHQVHTQIKRGYARTDAFKRVAANTSHSREDVVAGYWRHVRRQGWKELH